MSLTLMQFSGCNCRSSASRETELHGDEAFLEGGSPNRKHALTNARFHPNNFCGGFGEREIPVPIPNTAVKPLSADDTARATLWESKSPPHSLFINQLASQEAGCFALSRALILSDMKSWKWALSVAIIHSGSEIFVSILIDVQTRRFNRPPLPTPYVLKGMANVLNFPFDDHVWPLYLNSIFCGVIAYIVSVLVQRRRKARPIVPPENLPPIAEPNETKVI